MGGILDTRAADILRVKAPGSTNLIGEVALVTGSRGRLGHLWCHALKDAGALVIETDLPKVMQGESIFANCEPMAADITDLASVEALASQAWSTNPVTILVNNAGVDDRPTAESGIRPGTAADMAHVNMLGTYYMLQVFGARMARQGKGSIINIASLYGLVSPDMRYYGDSGFEKHAVYGATKAGIINMTSYFAGKYGGSGVRVNALAPGGVQVASDALTGKNPEFVANYTARIPMGRMCHPADLAGPLRFLASQQSSFITGQTIAVDGGFLAW